MIIRHYRDGDEIEILRLFEIVYSRHFDIARWNWAFKRRHFNPSLITVSEEDKNIVAQYAIRPINMMIDNEVVLCAFSLDTIVHPDYRNQGLFTKLAKYTYEKAAENGISFTYGFPNSNSQYGFFKRLNWTKMVDRIPLFIRILNVKGLLKKKIHNSILLKLSSLLLSNHIRKLKKRHELSASYKIVKIDRFDDGINMFWQVASKHYRIMSIRDKDALNWRYIENPTEQYDKFVIRTGSGEMLGYIVLKCQNKFGFKVGFIVDILTVDNTDEINDNLIGFSINYFIDAGMDMICCMMLEHIDSVKTLKKHKFMKIPAFLHPQELHFGILRHTSRCPEHVINELKNWYITWGDYDMI
jgi:hypothetical protein